MSVEELRANIDIILAQPDRRVYYNPSDTDRSWNSREEGPYIAQPGEAQLVNERVVALRLLYAQALHDEQTEFPALLHASLHESNARTIANLAVEIGLMPGTASAWLVEGSFVRRYEMWKGLTEKMCHEAHAFSDPDIVALLEVVNGERAALTPLLHSGAPAPIPPEGPSDRYNLLVYLDRFGIAARKVQFLRLSRRLSEGHNPEINADKQELVSRMAQLGFRADIAGSLDDLDRKVHAAGTRFDFKGCMDQARTIYEEIVEDAAKFAAAACSSPSPTSGPFKPWRETLVTTKVLTQDEGQLAQSLYNTLSNEASHKLSSAPEQLRVTKNMVIELGLLIVGRVQALRGSTSGGA